MATSLTSARGPRPLLAAPLLVALLPGLLVLLILPRLVDVAGSPSAATAVAVSELLLPLASAAVAGVLAAELGATARFLLLAGALAQLPALPGMLDFVVGAAGAGLVMDALFWATLYLAYLTLAAAAAYYAACWWSPRFRLDARLHGWPVGGLFAIGLLCLVWVVLSLSNGTGLWYHLLTLCAGAIVCGATLALKTRGHAHTLGWGLIIAGAGLAAFIGSIEYTLATSPPVDFDLPEFEEPAP